MTPTDTATSTPTALIERGIAAYKAGDAAQARAALVETLVLDPDQEVAWLWLSGVVTDDAERRYCLERVVALSPGHTAALRGLSRLPADVAARSPLPPPKPTAPELPMCAAPGCAERVARSGHTLCRAHWKAAKASPAPEQPLFSATQLGERLGLSNQQTNLLLLDLGWITREGNGYVPTPQGVSLGAVGRRHQGSGVAFVVWPEAIAANRVLQQAVRVLSAERVSAKPMGDSGFREAFPAEYRTADGHMVRSRAEALIDNWLYTAGIVHAYERQLPVEEEVYSDFYIPAGKVYIEFWGLEDNARYAARKAAKQAIYRRHGLNLIELTDEQLRNLDDALPRLLLKYGVSVG